MLQLAFVLITEELLVPHVLVTLVLPDAMLVPIVLEKPCAATRTRTARRSTHSPGNTRAAARTRRNVHRRTLNPSPAGHCSRDATGSRRDGSTRAAACTRAAHQPTVSPELVAPLALVPLADALLAPSCS